MYNAYVISLHKPKKLLKQISNYGLNPILIDGVNGKELSKETIKENTTYKCSLFCPMSVIGIAMSHIKVWKEIVKTKNQYNIVFEDDVVFVPDFKSELDTVISTLPDEYDIVYLGCFGCDSPFNIFSLWAASTNVYNMQYTRNNDNSNNNLIHKPAAAFATHAYIISYRGAKKLISYIDTKIDNHIDATIQNLLHFNLINSYTLNKRIAYQTSTDETQSSNSATNHPYILNNLLSKYYIDTKVRANYITTLSVYKLGNVNLSLCSFLFILSGVLLSTININIIELSIGYAVLNIPDIYINPKNTTILIHYILLIFPFIIFKYYKIWNLIENK